MGKLLKNVNLSLENLKKHKILSVIFIYAFFICLIIATRSSTTRTENKERNESRQRLLVVCGIAILVDHLVNKKLFKYYLE
jgi:mannose/fructose/N-acetylgalactosamine-specific phosphotransferase system component IIC